MKKIAVIFGTRPDTIKLAPLILELRKYPQFFSVITIATAQHRQMLDDVLNTFAIQPDYDLNVMTERQTLAQLTSSIIQKLDSVIAGVKPDLIIAQGDTTTTFIAGLVGFYYKIPVAHVEAGLRTKDKFNPFPEEINRRLTSHIADLHFTPTPQSSKLLLREGIDKNLIFCTGNTVIDALYLSLEENNSSLKLLKEEKRKVVITMHRRENLGAVMEEMCHALKELSLANPNVDFVFPVHLNPAVRDIVFPILNGIVNFHLIEPLSYQNFVSLIATSYFVITDSGGLQEEAPSLGKPVLVLRKVTERPEAVKFGTVKLVGTEKKKIINYAQRLLDDKKFYKKMAAAVNPYGDGKASQRIAAALLRYFGFSKSKMKEFVPRGR